MTTTTKITKKALQEFVRGELKTNQKWAIQAMVRIYERQTADEQISEETCHSNNVGFTGADARMLTSFTKQWQRKNWLSDKQIAYLMKRIPKYCRQIVDISNREKLEAAYLAS